MNQHEDAPPGAQPEPTTQAPSETQPHDSPAPEPPEPRTEAADGGRMPRLGLVAVIVAAVALSLGLMQNLSSTVAPMFLGLNLMIAAYPLYTGMVRLKVPKVVAAVVTMVTVFIILMLGILAVIWSITQVVSVMGDYTDQFTRMYSSAIGWLASLGLDQQSMLESIRQISPSNIIGLAGGILSGTSAAGGIIAVTIVGIVFMTMDLPSVQERLEIVHRQYPGFTASLTAVAVGIRRYWVVTTVFGLIVSLINGGVIVALGVSLPVVWIVLTFITNYIPNVGFVIGLVPPALLALVEKGPVTALIVVIAFCVINFVLQSIVQPKFTGDAVGITPAVSFISLLVWAWVFGALGALIALPATLTVKALLIDPDPRTRWLNAFISNEPRTAET